MSDPVFEAAQRAIRKDKDRWQVIANLPPAVHEPVCDFAADAAREALEPIRVLHVPFVCTDHTDERWLECEACCGGEWPCPTARLIYTPEELEP